MGFYWFPSDIATFGVLRICLFYLRFFFVVVVTDRMLLQPDHVESLEYEI